MKTWKDLMLLSIVATMPVVLCAAIVADTGERQECYVLSSIWSDTGSRSFVLPRGIAVDRKGDVYVVDVATNKLQKYDKSGKFITQWGSRGSEAGQFNTPWGVAVDSLGNVYVADTTNDRIQKFTPNGKFILSWGSSGTGNGQFRSPLAVSIDSQDNVYVADNLNSRIQIFNSSGKFISSWGSEGSMPGQLYRPIGVAVDKLSRVYVTDQSGRLQVFSSSGKYLAQIQLDAGGNSDLGYPYGVAIGKDDSIYVTYRYHSAIVEFPSANSQGVAKLSSTGRLVCNWGSIGKGEGQFMQPSGVAVDTEGNVYVADTANRRIQKFKPKPTDKLSAR